MVTSSFRIRDRPGSAQQATDYHPGEPSTNDEAHDKADIDDETESTDVGSKLQRRKRRRHSCSTGVCGAAPLSLAS